MTTLDAPRVGRGLGLPRPTRDANLEQNLRYLLTRVERVSDVAGANDGDPLLDEDDGILYLWPRRKPGSKSVKVLVSPTAIVEADVTSSGTAYDTDTSIPIYTFTADPEKVYVGVAYYSGTGGNGEVGRVYILTPYTYSSADGRPFIDWFPYPGGKPSTLEIHFTVTDDGDQVALNVRQWTDGGGAPGFTRYPTTGYNSDPFEHDEPVTKPTTAASPDLIVEAYAEDDASPPNISRIIRLRVRHDMVILDEPSINARLDEDDGELYFTWDPLNPAGVDRVHYLLSTTAPPTLGEVQASSDYDSTGNVLVHTFDPNGTKTQQAWLGYLAESPDSGGRDVGQLHVIPWTYRRGNDRPTVDLEYQGRNATGEKWLATVLDDGDQVALYWRVYDKGTGPPAYTREPTSGYQSDPLRFPLEFVHPEDGDPNKVIELYAVDDAGNQSDPIYKESDSDNIPTGSAKLEVKNADGEVWCTPEAIDTDALSWRLRFSKTGYADPTFNDSATDEAHGTAFGAAFQISAVCSAITAKKDDEIVYASGWVFNTSSDDAASQAGAVRSTKIRVSTRAGALRNALKSAWVEQYESLDEIIPPGGVYIGWWEGKLYWQVFPGVASLVLGAPISFTIDTGGATEGNHVIFQEAAPWTSGTTFNVVPYDGPGGTGNAGPAQVVEVPFDGSLMRGQGSGGAVQGEKFVAGIATDIVASGSDLAVDLDIPNLTADASPDGAADLVVTYDVSASAYKKVLLNDLPGGGGGGVTSVTAGTAMSVSPTTGAVVVSHADTSALSGAYGGSGIASITVDSLGHVTAVGTASYATTAALSAHTGSTSNPHSVTKSQVGLGNVENTALSTWAGSTSITTVGTIGTGTWQGTAIAAAYIGTHTHSSLTGSSNLDFTIASTLRMRLQTTTYDLQVDGDVVAYSTVTGCDRKLKTNIVRIADALAKVRRLHGYTYFKRGEPGAGVIAQEVAPVLPEVVRRVETLSGEHGGSYLAVDNAGLIGLLIEAVNELAVKLES